jgi:hypothetical protein
MLPSRTVRALTTPAFTPAEFTATRWSAAADKAKFANALMTFMAQEFPRPRFTRALYQRLSNTFWHIAHTNIDGYYSVFFETDADRLAFLDQTLRWPCHGDPAWTFSDVERAVQKRLRASGVIDILRMREADATRKRELAQLARLEAKYGAGASPAAAPTPAPSPQPTRQADLFAL